MTGSTVIGARSRYKAAVIRRRCMDRVPGGTVTRGTVAANCKGLANCQADHIAVGIMTVGTRVMRIRGCTHHRGVRMAGSTVG